MYEKTQNQMPHLSVAPKNFIESGEIAVLIKSGGGTDLSLSPDMKNLKNNGEGLKPVPISVNFSDIAW